ncbi:MAG: hypothetical protein QOC60_274 [Frankiaceae bacterium]|jgi:hypothetical protein|nr:hypothetical protein [Frankiaceae bacterium]MDQ1714329.1 hypothetical protein [Frankiaceae bacterium]
MTDAPELVEVRLLGLPIPLREQSTEHGEELMREMTLIAQQLTDGDGPDLPARLVQLVSDVRTNFGVFTEGANAAMDAAAEQGIAVIDEIVYRVPAATGAFCAHLVDIIDETDEFCRAGQHLLTLASPPEVLAYQHWILGEFVRQTAGEPAIAWPDFQRATR